MATHINKIQFLILNQDGVYTGTSVHADDLESAMAKVRQKYGSLPIGWLIVSEATFYKVRMFESECSGRATLN